VTLRLEYRAAARTLRDADVDEMHWRIVRALEQKFGAEVR
jgi:phenylalanyl-tRNA synthetase beta subunit